MKNVIYTINAKSENEQNSPNNTWEIAPLIAFKEYAKKVEADLVVLNEDSIPLLGLPSTLNFFQSCNMLKFFVFDHFVKSEYKKMILLDLDVFVRAEARDVFKEECHGIHMMPQPNQSQRDAFEYFLKQNFNLEGDCPEYYNGGMIYANKEAIIDFYSKVPQLGEWSDFYKSYNLQDNPTTPFKNSNGFYEEWNEQCLLSFFFHEQQIKVHPLYPDLGNLKYWLVGWKNKRPFNPEMKGGDAIHFCGPEGKERLAKMALMAKFLV